MSQVAFRRPRTGVSVALGVFAFSLSAGAYALVGLGKAGSVPANFTFYAGLFGLALAAGIALMRWLAPAADPALFPAAMTLFGLGFAMIYRLDGAEAAAQFGWFGVGLAAFATTLFIVKDIRMLNSYTFTIGLVGIVLLLLPMVPGVGYAKNGAQLWVSLGGINFQPSEIGKILIVIFLAGYLDRTKELLQVAPTKLGPMHLPQAKHLGPILLAWGISLAVLFVEKDLGASLLYFSIFVTMLWIATGRGSYLVIGGGLFSIGAFVAWQMFSHVQERVTLWFHALDPQVIEHGSRQLADSWFALASGGVFGTGLGQGQPWLISAAHTDFIFSAIGEELGLIGTTVLLLLSLLIVQRSFRIALAQRDSFTKLLVAGLATLYGVQVFVIVGGVTRLIPLTGITLPFVSYGGSSLVTNFVLLAILVRISAGPRVARTRQLPPSTVSPDPGAD